MPRDADFKQPLCADISGFSQPALYRRLAFGRHKALPGLVSGLALHAAVRCAADDQQALEQLCRDITRPPCRPRRARGPTPQIGRAHV